MYNIVLTNYGNTQISNKVILDGVILLSDYISNISTVTSVTGYSVKLDIQARGNVKDKIGNILIRDDSSNTYTAKTILFYKNVNSEKKIIAGFSQNSAIINKLNKAINLFLSFDFSVFTNGFQFALVQAGFSQASQNVDGLVHIEDPNVDFDDSYSVYSKIQIDNKLLSYAQTSSIPTKTSQLDNDSNFITQHQSIKTINNQSLVGTGNIAISQGEYNKINTISVNSTNQAPDSNKNVNIIVPTKTSQLTNDSGFITDGTGATNYVTIDTVQDITAAKTFKNGTDTTKIDGKEIIISGTETYNVEQNPDFPDTPTSATATIETKIDNNTISCNGNSIGYYRNYYLMFDQPSMQTVPYHCDGIEIKSKSYDSIWSNTDDKQHEWYSLTVSSHDINASHNLNYIEGLAFTSNRIRDNYAGDEENGRGVLFAISKGGAYFNTSVNFNLTTHFDSEVQFSSSVYLYQDNLFISDGNSPTSETIADYVKQASLYYNRANSVITATSDTAIEPRSNDTISLGTSTNKFSYIYATTFNGDLNGNASSATTATNADHAISADSATTANSATTATQDGNGNTISSYYCTLSTEQTITGIKQFNGNLYALGYQDDKGIRFGDNATSVSYPRIVGETVSTTQCALRQHYYVNSELKGSIQTTCDSTGNLTTITKVGRSGNNTSSVWTLGSDTSKLKQIYTDNIGSTSAPVKTMYISGNNTSYYIAIDNSGQNSEPTIAPSATNYCSLGTSSKHWYNAYINNLYIGTSGNSLINFIINSLSGSNSTNTSVGSIRVIKISVTNKGSDITIFSAGSNVSGYTIYQGSIANGTFNYKSSALTGTWKLLSELMTPSGLGGDTYTGSLYAIAMRVA